MNSTIEAGGTRFSAKTPDYVNQFGLDLDTFANAGALANDQSSATLAFSSTNEYFMPSAFFLVSDEGPATSTGAGPTVGAPAGGGVAHDGEALSADPGSWNGTGTLSYGYQWQRCDADGNNCQNIAGATGSHYTPSAADVGGTVRVVVTATNDAGHLDAHRLGADRHQGLLGAGQHHAARPLGAGAGHAGPPADRRSGDLERPGAGDLHLPVAALRRQGRQLRRHPRRNGRHLHAGRRRRRPHAARGGHGHQRCRLDDHDHAPERARAGRVRSRRPRRRRRRPDRRDELPAARRRRQVPPRRPRRHRDRPRARLHHRARRCATRPCA